MDTYTLTGRESRLSLALAIAHIVWFLLGNTGENSVHEALTVFTVPYAEN